MCAVWTTTTTKKKFFQTFKKRHVLDDQVVAESLEMLKKGGGRAGGSRGGGGVGGGGDEEADYDSIKVLNEQEQRKTAESGVEEEEGQAAATNQPPRKNNSANSSKRLTRSLTMSSPRLLPPVTTSDRKSVDPDQAVDIDDATSARSGRQRSSSSSLRHRAAKLDDEPGESSKNELLMHRNELFMQTHTTIQPTFQMRQVLVDKHTIAGGTTVAATATATATALNVGAGGDAGGAMRVNMVPCASKHVQVNEYELNRANMRSLADKMTVKRLDFCQSLAESLVKSAILAGSTDNITVNCVLFYK